MTDYLKIFDSAEYETNEINEKRVCGFTLAELMRASGSDWPLLRDDPETMTAFALALLHRRMRERGEVPPHYTSVTTCQGCGPVPIFPGVPETVIGCPWCFVRVQGLPVPRIRTRRILGRTVGGAQVVSDMTDNEFAAHQAKLKSFKHEDQE